MAKISSYAVDGSVSRSDLLIGSDAEANNETKNFPVGSLLGLTQVEEVLSTHYDVNQEPSGLDSPLDIVFGPGGTGTTADPVMMAANGTLTFNQAGFYFIEVFLNIERQGSSGNVTVTAFRALVNGTQFTETKAVDLAQTGVMVPYETTIPYQATAGDTMNWEVMRDSSGTDEGGLYTHTILGGWSNVPSAEMRVYKVG